MTAGSRWDRISSLFDQAIELPAAERAAWLARECGGDEPLRREVSRMLAAHERAEGILEQPVATPSENLLEHLRDALADRYAIEHEIGRGGSATIFVAHERKHGRRVVLKVLNPEVAAFFGADRFQREVRIAARLAHPHILGLIDSGSADGLLYYVMPYVQGETLRARLARDGRVPLVEAIVVLRDIADALAYAHRSGIVHRDLKPENVLCVGGHAFLMDFGVAMLLTPVAGDDHVTSPGSTVGTPAYMAPEQVVPDRRVDHRVDLFAWGLLAHEVLTGRLPNDSSEPAIAALCPEAPAELVRLVAGCLAVDPAKRIERAESLVAELEHLATLQVAAPPAPKPRPRPRRWLVPAGLVIAAALAVFVLVRGSADQSSATTIPIRSPIAVTTLVNETGDSSLGVWGRMAGDWITQGLQETGLVTVVPWPSARRASDRVAGERAAGRAVDAVALLREETGAKTVVTGSYYLVGDSLRFRVEVSDAQEARVLGALPPISVSRDDPERAIGVLRDRVMGSVAIWSSDRFARMPGLTRIPPSFDAYRAFDAGMQRFLDQRYDESAPDFERAFALDSSFVVALLYAASAQWNTDEYARADSAVRAVRARDAALSEYHRRWLEFFEAQLAGNVDAALDAARQASSLAPESRMSFLLAQTALTADRAEEARAVLEAIDPDKGELRGWSSYWTQLAHARHILGDHVAERRAAQAMRQRFPDRRVALTLEVRALAAQGNVAAIDSALARDRALPANTYWSQGAAMVVAGEELIAHGREAVGQAWLRRGIEWLRTQRAVDSTYYGYRFWLGSAQFALGDWPAAAATLTDLSAFMPERQRYRGLAMLARARVTAVDTSALGPELSYQRGERLLFLARLAAVRGDTTRALALATESIRAGVDGLSWLHASALQDLARLGPRARDLPRALQAVPGQPSRRAATR